MFDVARTWRKWMRNSEDCWSYSTLKWFQQISISKNANHWSLPKLEKFVFQNLAILLSRGSHYSQRFSILICRTFVSNILPRKHIKEENRKNCTNRIVLREVFCNSDFLWLSLLSRKIISHWYTGFELTIESSTQKTVFSPGSAILDITLDLTFHFCYILRSPKKVWIIPLNTAEM